jgi:glyoxylase-like metal-dependent hydrolase (beta-lactamase superfamily II)
MIEVRSFTFNPFQENTYLVINGKRQCFIIDPGCYFANEQNELVSAITSGGLKPVRLLNTHCHLDHIFGNNLVDKRFGLRPWMHSLERPLLDRSPEVGIMYNLPFAASPNPEGYLEDAETIDWDGTEIEVILAPGHSPGSLCFYFPAEGILLGGDVLFRESVGRTDLPGGDAEALERSIRQRLYSLPEEVAVYPGHGPSTTIAHEKRYNPFVSGF